MHRSHDGYKKMFVMVDHATKFVIAKPVKDESAKTVAKIFFEECATKELWSDRGTAFLSEVVKYVSDLFEVKQKFTSGYHPQTNGLTERFNRTIISELAKVVQEGGDNWVEMLPPKLFAYNTSIHASTRYTPFELIHTF